MQKVELFQSTGFRPESVVLDHALYPPCSQGFALPHTPSTFPSQDMEQSNKIMQEFFFLIFKTIKLSFLLLSLLKDLFKKKTEKH